MEFFTEHNRLLKPNELKDFIGFGQKRRRKVEDILNLKTKRMLNSGQQFYMSDEVIHQAANAWLTGEITHDDLEGMTCKDEILIKATIDTLLSGNPFIPRSGDKDQESKIAEATLHFVPVLVAGEYGFTPNARDFLSKNDTEAWSHVPGYCFDSEIEGYNTWFTIFMDVDGMHGSFYYPDNPVIGETIKVITPVGVIWWIHGLEGLARYCSTHYDYWLLELWSYQ